MWDCGSRPFQCNLSSARVDYRNESGIAKMVDPHISKGAAKQAARSLARDSHGSGYAQSRYGSGYAYIGSLASHHLGGNHSPPLRF